VISAPSGGGKTTLCQQLLIRHKEMARAVTCTTRPPRKGEIEGRDYYFLDPAAFAARQAAGDFLEHATVFNHCYGTPKTEVLNKLRQGSDVLLNVDVQGAATVCRRAAEDPELSRALVTVFLTPASLTELETRLKRRATDSPDELARRLSRAREEAAQWPHYQYLIISTSIAEDARQMELIIAAERLRQSRSTFTLGT
jgi:guanylate kinase